MIPSSSPSDTLQPPRYHPGVISQGPPGDQTPRRPYSLSPQTQASPLVQHVVPGTTLGQASRHRRTPSSSPQSFGGRGGLRDSLCSDPEDISPSESSREVTSILSEGPPPPDTKRARETHPPVRQSPLSHSPGHPRPQGRPWTSLCDPRPPFQVPPDHTVELRNQLYRAALLHNSSPFAPPTFPFGPPNSYFPRPAFPPNLDNPPLRLPFPPLHYGSSSFHPIAPRTQPSDPPPGTPGKRKRSPDPSQDKPALAKEGQYHLSAPTSSPTHFTRGSLIQLATGHMKKVEELVTEDFVRSADSSQEVTLDHSILVKMEPDQTNGLCILGFGVGKSNLQVTVSAGLEHPFFVFGRGWSSCSPALSLARYSLVCSQLTLGDVCITLTPTTTPTMTPSLTPIPTLTPNPDLNPNPDLTLTRLMPPPHSSPDLSSADQTVKRRRLSSVSPETVSMTVSLERETVNVSSRTVSSETEAVSVYPMTVSGEKLARRQSSCSPALTSDCMK